MDKKIADIVNEKKDPQEMTEDEVSIKTMDILDVIGNSLEDFLRTIAAEADKPVPFNDPQYKEFFLKEFEEM